MIEKINKSAVKFLSPLSTDETFKTVVAEAEKIIGGEYGSIFLEEGGQLKRMYTDADFLANVQVRSNGFTYTSFLSQIPYIVDVTKEKNFHKEIKRNQIATIIHIPLSYEEKPIGDLAILSKEKQTFSEEDLEGFKLFGALASMAIRKNQLYAETKNALETRDLFISLASHELRTPLTSINGYIQLLNSKLSKKDTVEAKWVKELYEESIRMTKLVKELLEVNKIKQGQLSYELRECTVDDFLDEAIKRYCFINPEKEVIYEKKLKDENPLIIGDSEKLLQMFSALLNNADKFSPKQTPIEVKVEDTKKQLCISIKDQGEGIARQDLNKVFGGFYKSDKQTEGLGVGLLLAKHIIQYHHGTIELKSKPKKGTTVQVRLPKIA
jgi:K+-sensing histidine kinase KdpD